MLLILKLFATRLRDQSFPFLFPDPPCGFSQQVGGSSKLFSEPCGAEVTDYQQIAECFLPCLGQITFHKWLVFKWLYATRRRLVGQEEVLAPGAHGRGPCRGFCLVATRGNVTGPDRTGRAASLVPACSVPFGSRQRTSDAVLSAHSKCRGRFNGHTPRTLSLMEMHHPPEGSGRAHIEGAGLPPGARNRSRCAEILRCAQNDRVGRSG